MAHHAGGGGSFRESAIADRVGLFTAIALLGGFAMAVVMLVKHPKIALPGVLLALVFTGICPSPTQHPLLGLLGIIVGFCLVKGD